jgi:hypothetical protein
MSFQFPTAWLSLVVRQTIRELNKDGGIDAGVICQWGGQDIALMHDPSSRKSIGRAFLTRIEVGDRILVRGKMRGVSFFDGQNTPATRLSLLIHKVKAVIKRTEETKNDGGFGSDGESSSDDDSSSNSESSSDDESSSDGKSSSDSESSSDNSSNPDRSGRGDPEKDMERRRLSKQSRTSTAIAKSQRQSRDITSVSNPNSDSSRRCDISSDQSHAEHGSMSVAQYTGDHEVLARKTPGIGMAGSTPRVYPPSFNAEGGGQQADVFEFNGRGQPLVFSKPTRRTNDPNIVYSFAQRFSDGSKRVICVATRMTAQESVDSLIVYENILGPFGTGLCFTGRVLC